MLNMNVRTIIADAGGPDALADKLGVDRSTVYDWQRNGMFPPARLVELHRALGIGLDKLTGLTRQSVRQVA